MDISFLIGPIINVLGNIITNAERAESEEKKNKIIMSLLAVILGLSSVVAVKVLKDEKVFSKVKEYISKIDIKQVPKKLLELLEKVENDKKSLDNTNDLNETNEK